MKHFLIIGLTLGTMLMAVPSPSEAQPRPGIYVPLPRVVAAPRRHRHYRRPPPHHYDRRDRR